MSISDDKLPLSPMQQFSAAGFRVDAAPDDGVVVDVCAEDRHGVYMLPFPVVFRDDDWWNAQTGEMLECFVAGWRARG
jgi:hypothetical protein